MVEILKRFGRDESGATAIEYGLLAAMIAVALIASFTVLGNTIIDLFGVGAGGAADVIETQLDTLSASE
ncbi:MAG: Flp family type IVb pilin [Devosia sp.]|uniref:Flp family type IVb pilin n=1 Tax=Devosia sp. TaxID=1871048 RepID=UPI0024C7AF2D|nr:Flp family type IVb pilin [Devosia sp.]UYN98468.1 MAG: Flp family type IVb pilin [Devosia sp.]